MHEATTDARLNSISAKIDDLSRQIDQRFEQVDKFFRLQLTLIGGGFAVIATLIAT